MLIDLTNDEAHLVHYILVRYMLLLAYTNPTWSTRPNVISSVADKFKIDREDNYEG